MLKNALTNLEEKPVSYLWILLGALSGLFPLVKYRDDMALFYYQGDEWTQMHEMDKQGLWSWVFAFFGENFMPVFKLIWAGLLYLGNGNYHVFLVFSFVVHVLVIFLFGCLLRQWAFGWITILFSQLVLALNHVHIEILSQSIQLSNLLAYAFLLLLLMVTSPLILESKPLHRNRALLIGLLSLLGALSFSRGLLNGMVVAFGLLMIWLLNKRKNEELLTASRYAMVPSILIAVITAFVTTKSASGSGAFSRLGDVAAHLYYQISVNPWLQQIRDYPFNSDFAPKLLVLNLIMIGLGLICAKRAQRPLLVMLLLLFLGNAVLLAWGRCHQPVATVSSWRYQYGILLVFAPLVGVFLERMIRFIPLVYLRVAIAVFLFYWISMRVSSHWRYTTPDWSRSRGSNIREAAASESIDPDAHTISQFSGVKDGRALELTQKFNLH